MTDIAVITPWLEHEELWDDYEPAVANCSQLVIVDDGSYPPLHFATLRLDSNAGFCRANNAGLAEVTCDRVVFLNNDIVADDPGWLDRLAASVEPGVLVGARLRYENHAAVAGIADPLPYLDGWCLAGMTEDFRTLGGWATTYAEPAYYSDNDLCLRARCLGMTLRECRVPIEHKTSVTTRPDGQGVEWGVHSGDPHLDSVMAGNYMLYANRARQLLGSVAA
jgi:GT2 family glycosyltransferase